MTKEQSKKRKAEMVRLHKKGESYEMIRLKFGISKTRVHQIVTGYRMMKPAQS